MELNIFTVVFFNITIVFDLLKANVLLVNAAETALCRYVNSDILNTACSTDRKYSILKQNVYCNGTLLFKSFQIYKNKYSGICKIYTAFLVTTGFRSQ